MNARYTESGFPDPAFLFYLPPLPFVSPGAGLGKEVGVADAPLGINRVSQLPLKEIACPHAPGRPVVDRLEIGVRQLGRVKFDADSSVIIGIVTPHQDRVPAL